MSEHKERTPHSPDVLFLAQTDSDRALLMEMVSGMLQGCCFLPLEHLYGLRRQAC